MIKVESLNKSFGENHVLRDINFTFEQGKVNILIGQSGSGKTVLLKNLVGLFIPDSGRILFGDINFLEIGFNEKKEIRREIGMLFQGGALFDYMTVEENIKFPLSMFTKMTEKEQKDRANSCLERVNLLNTNKLYPAEISGGMKKRVAIARAISMNPKYLFCDEPNSGLDPSTSILIDNLIMELTEEYNMTTIVITHDMNSVLEIGDNINFIYKGEAWWSGDKNQILNTENKEINDFVYASKYMKMLKEAGKI
ncbi:MAG: ATP-binding cassette domain-containing protein [Bacteroidetes bacterium]|nr:ATP-binding cassette domain-containing protein [Bacteroidota bacterium]